MALMGMMVNMVALCEYGCPDFWSQWVCCEDGSYMDPQTYGILDLLQATSVWMQWHVLVCVFWMCFMSSALEVCILLGVDYVVLL
jgi:hypothetical protein